MPEEEGHGLGGDTDCLEAIMEGQKKVLHLVLDGCCIQELSTEGRRYVWGIIEKIENAQKLKYDREHRKPKEPCGCNKPTSN